MLRKCWSSKDESDGVDVKLNCFINSSCCAEGRMKDIEVVEAKDDTDQKAIEIAEIPVTNDETNNDTEIAEIPVAKDETDNVDENVIADRGKTVKEDILRSESPSRSNIHKCFGSCCASVESKGKTMANETADLHIAS